MPHTAGGACRGGGRACPGGAEGRTKGAEEGAGGAEEGAGGAEERAGGAEEGAGGAEERVGGLDERAGGPRERVGEPEGHPEQSAGRAGAETEIPFPEFEIAVFENRFPAFAAPHGASEVVVYTDAHNASFGTLAADRAEELMWVWRHRYAELGARADVEYVLIFENRGVEVGVTLHHPHGQIYGYPFLPPYLDWSSPPTRVLAAARRVPCSRGSSPTGDESCTRTTAWLCCPLRGPLGL